MKILIADDEQHIIRTLKSSLASYEFSEIIEAEDGVDAYEKNIKFKPDIIIADIKMPIMDGISLLSKLRENGYTVVYIILSGYDYFEYAQKAIMNGAFSYLLKPINEYELHSCINAAITSIELSKKQLDKLSTMKIKSRQDVKLLRRHLLTEIATGVLSDKEYILNSIHELDIIIEFTEFLVVVARIDDYVSFVKEMSTQDRELIKFSIQNIMEEYFTEAGFIVYSFNIQDGEGFLINFDPRLTALEGNNFMSLCMDSIDSINRILNVPISVGIGTVVTELDKLAESYASAQRALGQKLINSNDKVFASNKIKTAPNNIFIGFKLEQQLLLFFERNDLDCAVKLISDVYNQYFNSLSIDIEDLKKLNYQLIILIYKILNQFKLVSEDILGDELTLCNQVNNVTSIESIILFFADKLAKSFNAITASRDKTGRSIVSEAIKYISSNFNKDINLESVAEHFKFSPEYFSREFKKESGENFIDYMIRIRIYKAKQLLKEKNMTVSEVSYSVGYCNIKYFSKLFKKYTGFTPGAFRDMLL
ncbi:MAG TPA: response regulator [Ruminiclostridium sp.]